MKNFKSFLILILVFINFNSFSQLKVFSSGNTVAGPNTIWNLQSFNINGNGLNGCGGLLSFGDNTSITNNILLGEYGTGDTDQLLLHGKKGIYITTKSTLVPRFILSEDGDIGIGETVTSGHRMRIHNNAGSNYRGLVINQYTSSSYYNYGIVSSIPYGTSGGRVFGLVASAYRGSSVGSARSTGVQGKAGNGASGYNYGVYGLLMGSTNGAAVYGDGSGTGDISIPGKYAGYFKGNVHITGNLTVTGSYPSSDINLKKDIRVIEDNVLERLAHLQSIRYKMKHPSEYESVNDTAKIIEVDSVEYKKYTKDNIGLIAQELQEQFPEVVLKGDDGFLRVNYDQIIPILVKAINMQQEQIDILETKIEANTIKKSISSQNAFITNENDDFAKLYQNTPNPFNENTIIRSDIPKSCNIAFINIYYINGVQIESHEIMDRGHTELIINSARFNPGIYLYALIVDGIEVDIKRMIFTD